MASNVDQTSSFRNQFLPKWSSLFDRLFPVAKPTHAEWRNLDDMVAVLSAVGATANLNHCFHPSGGGSDLASAVKSHEDGCLELNLDLVATIVLPHILTCEVFHENSEWSYFRLETAGMKPSGVYGESSVDLEELLELSPGVYADIVSLDEGNLGYSDDGEPIALPQQARAVARRLSGGAYVIFCKASRYNLDSSTYDARHNKMSADAFREYIAQAAGATASS